MAPPTHPDVRRIVKPPHSEPIPGIGEIGQAMSSAGIVSLPQGAEERFHTYLELLLRWNRRINLISDREPSRILERHLIECAFVAMRLPREIERPIKTVLDFGSGAGLPGIPIAICRPEIRVTLAESQSNKAAFLEEALRVLQVEGEVWHGRVESMPATQTFDAVSLRAVERMKDAIGLAAPRARTWLAWMTSWSASAAGGPSPAEGFSWSEPDCLPHSEQRILLLGQRIKKNL